MSTNSEDNFLTHFDTFLAGLDKHDEQEKLFMLAGLVELLRHTKSATDVMYMAELLVSLQYIDWSRIPFSITRTVLTTGCHDDVKRLGVPEELIPTTIRSGLLLFLDEIQADPSKPATYELLQSNIRLAAESLLPPEEPPANPKLPAAKVEVFNPRLVRRVFTPAKFTPELAEQLRLQLVTYRGVMSDKKLGPALRGVATSNDGGFNVFLESGEFVQVSTEYEHLHVSTAPEDFKHINPAVLLLLTAAVVELEAFSVLDADQAEQIKAGSLGKLHATHFRGVTDADDLFPLEHVFDIGREAVRMGVTGATGPVGASVRFPVPATENLAVVLEAQQDTYGPYSHARLVEIGADGKDVVLMRHETPRHYSLRGVYLFPLQDRLVSLTAIF